PSDLVSTRDSGERRPLACSSRQLAANILFRKRGRRGRACARRRRAAGQAAQKWKRRNRRLRRARTQSQKHQRKNSAQSNGYYYRLERLVEIDARVRHFVCGRTTTF